MLAGRELEKLKVEYPQLEIKEIDVLLHPLEALKNNIRMIPALQGGKHMISGIFLSGKKIRNFTENYLKSQK